MHIAIYYIYNWHILRNLKSLFNFKHSGMFILTLFFKFKKKLFIFI